MAAPWPKLVPLLDAEPVCQDCGRRLVSGEFVQWEDGERSERARCAICAVSAAQPAPAAPSEPSPG